MGRREAERAGGDHEAFADEFARWAGRMPGSLSAYGTPPLLPDDRFRALVEGYARPQPPARMFGAWPRWSQRGGQGAGAGIGSPGPT